MSFTAIVVGQAPQASPDRAGKARVIETVKKALGLFEKEPVAGAHAAAQLLGMHLVPDAMEITFTPRDRQFSSGSAVREWHTEQLGVVILEVDPHVLVKFGPLRSAFGPFKMASRQHPGDEAIFVAYPKVGASQTDCQVSVTMRKFTEQPTDDDAVERITITR